MTSSQPVVTPNALNFTPDNKHVWWYTGLVAGASTGTNISLGSINTNSEYIVGTVQALGPIETGDSTNGSRTKLEVYFNDVLVLLLFNDYDTGNMMQSAVADLIIPPFTKVELKYNDSAGSTYLYGASIVGKAYGMTDTGYQ